MSSSPSRTPDPSRWLDPVERFNARIEISDTGCWLWTACKNARGYACMWVRGKFTEVQRWAYEHFKGPIPEGLQIDHLCRVRHCVNPDHLEAVTRRENILRGESAVAVAARRTHCIRGHEFTPENTAIKANGLPAGKRVCLKCRREEGCVRRRIQAGWDPEVARTTPARPWKRHP